MKPSAYQGNLPYAFISYAHRDTEKVFQILDELYKRGYRFWYDEGIAPGSEWPEEIASHLNDSALLIAFISNESVQSENCRREINFALSKKKPLLAIVLEQTDIPLGMQMQLSTHQNILRYNYGTWEAFIDKILKCPNLAPCQAETGAEEQADFEAPSRPEPAVMRKEEKEARILELIAKTDKLHTIDEYNEELKALAEGLELDPENITFLIRTGRAYRCLGFPQKALEYYEKAKAVNPDDPTLLTNIGAVHLSQGEYAAARPYYEKGVALIERNPSSVTAHDAGVAYGNYAFCLGKVGDIKGAKKHLKNAKAKGYPQDNINNICQQLNINPRSIEKRGLFW